MQVIEFFGLPGCGKTTQCRRMHEEGNNVNVATIRDVSLAFRKASVLRKLNSIPFYFIFPFLKVIFSAPFVGFKNWRLYRTFYSNEHFINFSTIYLNNDIFAIEHGHVQGIISMLWGKKEILSDCFLDKVKYMLNASKTTQYIYLETTIPTTVDRIRIRNRKNSGRLDQILCDSDLKAALSLQKHQFEQIYEYCRENGLDVFKIDMN